MLKHLVILSTIPVLLFGCNPNPINSEQPEETNALQELKLDSIRSVITIVLDNGEDLQDDRINVLSGVYKKDENETIRSLSFSAEELLIDSTNHLLTIDLINLESWDSTKQHSLQIDSAFLLSNVSHLALSTVTMGNVTNEILFPIQIDKDSSKVYFEGKTTLTLKDWGFENPSYKLHLGLSLYSLSEK